MSEATITYLLGKKIVPILLLVLQQKKKKQKSISSFCMHLLLFIKYKQKEK